MYASFTEKWLSFDKRCPFLSLIAKVKVSCFSMACFIFSLFNKKPFVFELYDVAYVFPLPF